MLKPLRKAVASSPIGKCKIRQHCGATIKCIATVLEYLLARPWRPREFVYRHDIYKKDPFLLFKIPSFTIHQSFSKQASHSSFSFFPRLKLYQVAMRLLEIFTFLFVTLAIAAPAVDNTNAAVDSTNNMGGGPDHHRCRYGYDECLWVSAWKPFTAQTSSVYGPTHFLVDPIETMLTGHCLQRCDREGHHEGERWCRGVSSFCYFAPSKGKKTWFGG